jgi:hypothetical protein
MGSEEPAIPLEPPASSAEEAELKQQKRKRAKLTAEEAELKQQKRKRDKLRYLKQQAAGGKIAYREQQKEAKQEALSKLPAEEAARKQQQRKINNQHYVKQQAAGGKIAYQEKRQKARQQEKEEARAQALLRKEQRQQEKEEARAQALLRKEQREQEKEKARAQARAQALLRKEQREQQGEQWARDMAAKVRTTLAQSGMMQKCLASIKGGSQEVKDWTRVVRNHGNTGSNKPLCYVDIEGRAGDVSPPYSATVVANNFQKTWSMNPSPRGAASTFQECQVYPKP